MTARRADLARPRAIVTALATVSPAAHVCASADLFRVPRCFTSTASILPPNRVCFSSNKSSEAFKSAGQLLLPHPPARSGRY